VLDIISGNHPMPNEVSHEGAIARGMAALMESTTAMQSTLTAIGIVTQETNQKVGIVIERVEGIEYRVERLEGKGRKDPTLRQRSIYKFVLWNYYGGHCPIYRDMKILDSETVVTKGVTKAGGSRSLAEVDHWYGRQYNQDSDMWMISHKAHNELTKNPQLRHQWDSAFREFQRHLGEFLAKTEPTQLTII
jgi:hypothetical protein